MPKNCEACGRGPLRGNIRSHSNIATTRWQRLNIQRKYIDGKSINICARCLRSLAKKKAKAQAVK